MLTIEVLNINSKIIILLSWSKSVKQTVDTRRTSCIFEKPFRFTIRFDKSPGFSSEVYHLCHIFIEDQCCGQSRLCDVDLDRGHVLGISSMDCPPEVVATNILNTIHILQSNLDFFCFDKNTGKIDIETRIKITRNVFLKWTINM